ncbi:hypothetical protein [Shimia abyssi]|uniref:Phage terminase small subunit n=1 Tax=Shimia abyssi TaxID=1662395 RepID=A0A2P8EWF2_9RHOB|nr:hypothetical protein [Shimia abyssi]PSL13807.1 hypothetical protein CLV88_1312 [Shimia abyssi]
MGQRTESTSHQVKAAQHALLYHEWPEEAGTAVETDLAMYQKLQQQRAHADWTPSDLISLANLSKLQTDVVREHDKLRAEGLITYGGKSGFTPIQNPRQRIVQDLNSSINSLARRLGLTSKSLNEKRAAASRTEAERKAREVLSPEATGGKSRSGRDLM